MKSPWIYKIQESSLLKGIGTWVPTEGQELNLTRWSASGFCQFETMRRVKGSLELNWPGFIETPILNMLDKQVKKVLIAQTTIGRFALRKK